MPNLNVLILVIEDDRYMNETLCEVLESEGYNVESASNALDAINKIKYSSSKYHVLVLDYNIQYLNGITGLDIFEIAKEKDPDVKGVLITAYGKNKEIREMAYSAGINSFIEKPFLITDLVDTIDDISRGNEVKNSKRVKV
jgi:DNA-binding NtrC family response regulator